MNPHPPRQGTHPPVAARKPRKRLGRLAGVLAAVTCALLTAAAIGPAAAFAVTEPPPTGGGAPASQTTVHIIAAGGTAGWQIAMIALGAALFAAVATFLTDRAIAARRAAQATTA
jgi:hypothetical protein